MTLLYHDARIAAGRRPIRGRCTQTGAGDWFCLDSHTPCAGIRASRCHLSECPYVMVRTLAAVLNGPNSGFAAVHSGHSVDLIFTRTGEPARGRPQRPAASRPRYPPKGVNGRQPTGRTRLHRRSRRLIGSGVATVRNRARKIIRSGACRCAASETRPTWLRRQRERRNPAVAASSSMDRIG